LSVALLAVLLLEVGNARGFELFRCDFTGATQAACCCPEAAERPAAGPVIARACCCHVQHVEADLPATAAFASKLANPPAGPLLVSLPLAGPSPTQLHAYPPYLATPTQRDATRVRAGPRLTIVHRRLLI
jgi:hypothetical protein